MENLHDLSLWGMLTSHRPLEVWAALAGGVLYAFQKSAGKTKLARSTEAGISGLIGYSMGVDAAEFSSVSPEIASFLLTAVGYLFLDGIRAIIADRAEIRAILVKILGGGHGNGK